MKRFIKFLFCLTLGITFLTGCGKETGEERFDFATNSFRDIYFDFYDYRPKTNSRTFLFETPVIDIINLSEDEFYDQYLGARPENKYDYYTFDGIRDDWNNDLQTNDHDFFGYENIREYVNRMFGHIKDDSYEKLVRNIMFCYHPTEYTVTFVGLEDKIPDPKTYTVETNAALPYIGIIVDHRSLEGWLIQGTDTVITRYPNENPRDLILEPYFKTIEYSIKYVFPGALWDVRPDNPTKYTYYDDPITLVNFQNHPDGAYTFDGFYLNGEKIDYIDPHIGKNIEIECRFTFKEYTAKFYVDDELIDTKTFTYLTLNSFHNWRPLVPKKDHLENGRWDTTPTECRDYEIHAVYDRTTYKIIYTYPFEGVENPNITTFTAFDGEVDLTPLADSNKGYYTFEGFYLNGKKITALDTSIGKDVTIETRFDLTNYQVNYYDGDKKLYTDTFTFLTFKDYVQREVPDKEHYKDGKWSEEVKEIKNYDIYASYAPKKYTVKIISTIDDKQISNDFVITYGDGTAYSSMCQSLSFKNKYFIGLYSDANYSTAVSLSSTPDKDITLYAKWGSDVYIESASDWAKIVANPSGHYYLANNISFVMESVPVIDNFTGLLDGCNYKIQRFSNTKTDCNANYGLFKTNNGTIKNLTIEDASFVSTNANGSDRVYCGVLCGTNKGTIENVDFVSVNANITANYYIEINDFSNMYGYCYVGLCCGNNQGTIKNCSIADDCQLTAKAKIGYKRNVGASMSTFIMYGYFYYGLLAGLNTGTITNVVSDGTLLVNGISVSESTKTWSYSYMDGTRYLTRTGGVVGRNGNGSNVGTVKDCISNAKITVDYPDSAEAKTDFSSENRIGGVVGNNEATVENCYASSSATLTCNRKNDLEMGGIVGRQESTGKVRGCYSECAFSVISSSGSIRIGGVIGCNCGSLSYSYAIVNDATVSGSVNRSGGIGALVGYTNDTSTVMFCFGLIEITNEISIVKCYDIGSTTTNAVLNKITIYAPDQTNTINQNDKSTKANSLEDLIQAAKTYYFDEAGFTLYDNKLPTL